MKNSAEITQNTPLINNKNNDTINNRTLWGLRLVCFLSAFDMMVVFLTVRDYWVVKV